MKTKVFFPSYKSPFTLIFSLSLIMLLRCSIIYCASKDTYNDINAFSRQDLKIGERLFNGLIKTGEHTVNCASCHNIHELDTFNWNPSAHEIALTFAEKSMEEFKTVLMQPSGTKMPEVHENINLTDQEIRKIKGFLLTIKKEGKIKSKPTINRLLSYLGLIILITLAVTDLIITRKIPYKIVHTFLILLAISFILKLLITDAIALGRQHLYQPDQPVKFSHLVHAGTNGTDCLYCHHIAENSKSAGIPSNGLCLNCHSIIMEGTFSGKFEIAKIHQANNNSKSVEWVRVHNLPDHVFFSHTQHANVGKIDCQECHGRVEERHEIRQENDLSMGWCLDCHRARKVQFSENIYYSTYHQLKNELKNNKIDSVLVENVGGTDCMKCHY